MAKAKAPNWFKIARLSAGISHCYDAADSLRYSRRMMYAIERGDRKPSLDQLQAIADLYKCTTDYLLGRRAGKKEGA